MMQIRYEKYMAIAQEVAQRSTDPNRKVGAVIAYEGEFVSYGCNEFPIGIKRDTSKDKLAWTVHAEIRAITTAAKRGFATHDSILYTTYFPCATCAGAIINAGIIRVVAPLPDWKHHRWGESWRTAIEMFKEAGVEVCYLKFD